MLVERHLVSEKPVLNPLFKGNLVISITAKNWINITVSCVCMCGYVSVITRYEIFNVCLN